MTTVTEDMRKLMNELTAENDDKHSEADLPSPQKGDSFKKQNYTFTHDGKRWIATVDIPDSTQNSITLLWRQDIPYQLFPMLGGSPSDADHIPDLQS